MCECYKIGGTFIAEDPNCPVHGIEAQKRRQQIHMAVNLALVALRKTRALVDTTASQQHAAWAKELDSAINGLEKI